MTDQSEVMTREEIVAMAREAGLQVAADYDYRGSFEKLTFPEREEFLKLLHFAALVAACEREACARVCENDVRTWSYPGGITREECAAAIRARGES